MKLLRAIEQCEEGDRFAVNGDSCSYREVGFVGGELVYCDDKVPYSIDKHNLNFDYEFTYRAKRCPHCGKVIKEES